MTDQGITEKDRRDAQECVQCPMRGYAARPQGRLTMWFIKTICRLCPYRKGHVKVYGRAALEGEAGDGSRAM
jgi:hypothetical protein